MTTQSKPASKIIIAIFVILIVVLALVAVVPMLDDDTVLLIREYAAGVHRYELGLVKGRIDAGETSLQAADRELKEEAGYGARSLDAFFAVLKFHRVAYLIDIRNP